jgi:hypothetical protein
LAKSRRCRFSVLLPTSLTADAPDLRSKTQKLGLVGRTLAIFRVTEVCVYNDDEPGVRGSERELIADLLSYIETPQYLRKLLFGKKSHLRFAGTLPPLRTPHHPLASERAGAGDVREGVVIEAKKGTAVLELGLKKKGLMSFDAKVGDRLTVRLLKWERGWVLVEPLPRKQVGEYWGYEVLTARNLVEGIKQVGADFVLATSRYGSSLHEVLGTLKGVRRLAVVFGGPYAGLFEICKRQGLDPRKLFNAIVNTIPEQGTATVRTEEALVATLALLNHFLE